MHRSLHPARPQSVSPPPPTPPPPPHPTHTSALPTRTNIPYSPSTVIFTGLASLAPSCFAPLTPLVRAPAPAASPAFLLPFLLYRSMHCVI